MKASRIVFFLLGFGLLPLWISIVWLIIGGYQHSNSSDYWNVAPWMVILGIVFCKYTIGIAIVTIAVHTLVKGTPERKRKLAWMTFVVLVLIAAAWIAYGFYDKASREADQKSEKATVLEFVQDDATVQETIGDDVDVNLSTTTMNRDGEIVRYEISVSPAIRDYQEKSEKTQYAIVDVSRTDKRPTYSIRCLTPVFSGQRDPHQDPCQP